MTYDVVQKVNGNMVVVSSWTDNRSGAIKAFHDRCALLWADTETTNAVVKLFDDNMDVVEGKMEIINKTV